MKNRSMRRTVLYILPALFIGLGSWAYSEAAGTTISVCVQKDGDMRMIGIGFSNSACKNRETLVSWNIQGPKGDLGAKGDAGLIGATGTPGIAGINGKDGVDGLIGTKGDKGEAGTPAPSLHLFDANNQDLGILLGSNNGGEYQIYIPSLKLTTILQSKDNPNPKYIQLIPEHWGDTIEFEDTNCTGVAVSGYASVNSITQKSSVNGVTHYYRAVPVPNNLQKILSRLDIYGTCTALDQDENISWQLEEIILPFTEPLIWPLHIQSI